MPDTAGSGADLEVNVRLGAGRAVRGFREETLLMAFGPFPFFALRPHGSARSLDWLRSAAPQLLLLRQIRPDRKIDPSGA